MTDIATGTVAAKGEFSAKRVIIVAACLFGISAGPAAFGLSSIGLFIDTFHQKFGWSRTEVSLAASIMMLCTAISLPLVGRVADRHGARVVLIPSIIALGGLFLILPFAVTQLWQFIAVYVLMGTVAAGTNSVPYMRILASWFDRRRGLAIGIAGSGTGLGFAYVPIVGQWAIGRYGWQGGYVALALILLCVSLPLALFVLREHPHASGDEKAAEPEALQFGDSPKDAMGRRDFWVLGAIFVTLAFVLYGLIPHLVPLLTDRGVAADNAAQIASLFGLATFAGRIVIGFLIDRFDARLIAMIFFAASGVGLGVLALDLPAWAFLIAAIMLGGSLGAEVDMLAYLTSRYFGLKSFAQIFGLLFSAVMVAMGLGPMAFGAVFDATGSYAMMLAVGAPICFVATALVLLLRPYGERKRGAPISAT